MNIYLFINIFGFVFAFINAENRVDYKVLPVEVTIANPERGYFRYTDTESSKPYKPLSYSTLAFFKASNYTLIWRYFYIDAFMNSPISQSYLNSIQSDFNTLRQAGLKIIIRFAYSRDYISTNIWDTNKSQILTHIAQLKPLIQSNYDVIAVFQAGFIGVWGEWYWSNYFGPMPQPNENQLKDRKEVLEAILDAVPSSRFVQIRYNYLKRKMYGVTSGISPNLAYSETSSIARIGHHCDCFLASDNDWGTYINKSIEFPYLEQDTKYAPMGGETCNPNPPRSECPTALYELEKLHYSFLHIDYEKTVLEGFKRGGCYNTIENRLGYRYELINGVFPSSVSIKSSFKIEFTIKNSGFASCYNRRPVNLVLRNTLNKNIIVPLKTDPRLWAPGQKTLVEETINLPDNFKTGFYRLFLSLPDASPSISARADYAIRLANEGLWEYQTGYNDLRANIHFTD